MRKNAKPRRRPVQYPRNFKRFLEAFLHESRAMIDAFPPESWGRIRESLHETLANPEGKLPNLKVRLTQRETFFQRLRFDFNELHAAFETLSDFPALSRMSWPSNSDLTAGKVILFWREAHFNECYIYHSRLLSFLKHLGRAYRKDLQQARLVDALNALIKALESDFEVLKAARGQHVHELRHRHLDAEMDRLSLLELLIHDTEKSIFTALYRQAVRTAKANNTKRFQAFVKRMRRETDCIFKVICAHIISKENRLIYPSHLKTN